MSNEFSSEASVVALYGLQFSASRAEACYRHLVEWFDSLGFHPDRSGVSGSGFSEKVGTFDRFDKRLQRGGFGTVHGFHLYRLIPGGDIPGYHWCVTAGVYEKNSYCIVGAGLDCANSRGVNAFDYAYLDWRYLSALRHWFSS